MFPNRSGTLPPFVCGNQWFLSLEKTAICGISQFQAKPSGVSPSALLLHQNLNHTAIQRWKIHELGILYGRISGQKKEGFSSCQDFLMPTGSVGGDPNWAPCSLVQGLSVKRIKFNPRSGEDCAPILVRRKCPIPGMAWDLLITSVLLAISPVGFLFNLLWLDNLLYRFFSRMA